MNPLQYLAGAALVVALVALWLAARAFNRVRDIEHFLDFGQGAWSDDVYHSVEPAKTQRTESEATS